MADGPPPTGEHAGSLNRPAPFDVNLTLPVGVLLAAPPTMSVTVTVHLDAVPTATVPGEQLTTVEVERRTVMVSLPPLPVWLASPP